MECRDASRQLIRLVETLWDVECRRLLGTLSAAERRQAVAAALAASQVAPGRAIRSAGEVHRE